MSEIEDYAQANKVVSPEKWIARSGVYKGQDLTLEELTKILKLYRGYIYEAEMRPQITYEQE